MPLLCLPAGCHCQFDLSGGHLSASQRPKGVTRGRVSFSVSAWFKHAPTLYAGGPHINALIGWSDPSLATPAMRNATAVWLGLIEGQSVGRECCSLCLPSSHHLILVAAFYVRAAVSAVATATAAHAGIAAGQRSAVLCSFLCEHPASP